MRVLTIVGTRPELVKLSRIIARFDEAFTHRWIHTGQNWSANLRDVFLDELGIRAPDVQGVVTSATPAAQVAEMLAFVDDVLDDARPDAVLVLGDTNSALTAYAARRRGVPVFHMEAGNRAFDDRTPEEINRRMVDHFSDVNLAYSQHARQHLLREGIRPDRIFVVGSPYREVVDYHLPAITARRAPERLGLSNGQYVLASLHREENVDDDSRRRSLLDGLGLAARVLGTEVVFAAHPRTAIAMNDDAVPPHVQVIAAPGFIDFLSLAMAAHCVVSDSGSLTEESAVLGFPAVTLRRSHERPEGMDAGVLTMADPVDVAEAVRLACSARAARSPIVDSYAPTDVSWRVANIVASYTRVLKDDHRTTV